MLVLEGIAEGRLRQPGALAGYVWATLRNLLRKKIGALIDDRKRRSSDFEAKTLPTVMRNPEAAAILSQQRRNVKKALAVMPSVAREILRRFYLEGSSARDIQHHLGITPTQFRLIKNRAKGTLIQKFKGTDPPVIPSPVVGKARLSLVKPRVRPPRIANRADQHRDIGTIASASPDVCDVNCIAA
jgi:RNA polymerase sigma factor (sigma-70 family)